MKITIPPLKNVGNSDNVICKDNVTSANNFAIFEITMKLGERYKQWRESRTLPSGKPVSNYLVSERTGIARANLTNLEKGIYHPSDEVLQKIATVEELELPLEKLRGWQIASEYEPGNFEAVISYKFSNLTDDERRRIFFEAISAFFPKPSDRTRFLKDEIAKSLKEIEKQEKIVEAMQLIETALKEGRFSDKKTKILAKDVEEAVEYLANQGVLFEKIPK